MDWKNYFSCVLKGLIGSIAVTVILTAILSLFMTFVKISESMFSGLYVVITSLGLVFGTILAAKLHGKNWWLVGLAVGVFFYIALYITGVLLGASSKFGLYELIRFALCVIVGFLSGMLGINIGES